MYYIGDSVNSLCYTWSEAWSEILCLEHFLVDSETPAVIKLQAIIKLQAWWRSRKCRRIIDSLLDKKILNASEKDDVAQVLELLEKGANVNAATESGQTPIHLMTPLHCASWKGHVKVASLLIAKGAKVNAENEDKQTPLHDAIIFENEEMVILLLEKGADVNAEDKKGRTPLYWASEYGNTAIAKLLQKYGAK